VALSPGRKWLFRLLALVVLPLLLLGGLEMALRLSGFGYSPDFFKTLRKGGTNCLVNNPDFSLRFFPPPLARWPDPFLFPAAKPPDTVRIFIFGESAAMGDPQPAYAASRYLEVLLRQRYPQKKFEVINLGITAINSHVILPIARECARQHGDFWIVYMGNNEMVGPYGAATVFSAQALPLPAVRLNLALQGTRIGQLLVAASRKLSRQAANPSWAGMEMFLENRIRPGDPRKEVVYRNFAANLDDIVTAGIRSGATVIVNTVAVNLRDCPPFASLTDSNRPAADRQRAEQLFAESKSLQAQTNYPAAAARFTQALALDSQMAEAHFRLAQCQLELTNPTAPEQFQAACDDDALPFRADSRINAAIRQVAQQHGGGRVALCDAAQALGRAAPGGLTGDETFYEHVHFNFDGNYRLGKLWAEEIGRQLTAEGIAPATPDWASVEACDRALGLTIWNRHFVLQSVLRRLGAPPLNAQFNNGERLRRIGAEDMNLRRLQAEPGAVQRARDEYAEALQAAPADARLYEGLANFLEAILDRPGAIAAYRRMLELLPEDFYANLQLGRLLGEVGQPAQGQPFLEQAVRLRPSLPEGWFELGNVLAAQSKLAPALECLERAARLRPSDASSLACAAQVLGKLNRHAEAIEKYRQAIQTDPQSWEAHCELAEELVAVGQPEAALREYAEALKLNPRHVISRINLGVLLVRFNRLDDAIAAFQSALELEPTNRIAREYLDSVLAHKTQNR